MCRVAEVKVRRMKVWVRGRTEDTASRADSSLPRTTKTMVVCMWATWRMVWRMVR